MVNENHPLLEQQLGIASPAIAGQCLWVEAKAGVTSRFKVLQLNLVIRTSSPIVIGVVI